MQDIYLEDPTNIIGMSAILADETDDADFDALEQDIINAGGRDPPKLAPEKDFLAEYKNKTREYSNVLSRREPKQERSSRYAEHTDFTDDDTSRKSMSKTTSIDDFLSKDHEEEPSFDDHPFQDVPRNTRAPVEDFMRGSAVPDKKISFADDPQVETYDPRLEVITNEEIKAQQIRKVLAEETEEDDNEPNILKMEYEEDEQIKLVESIDELRKILEDDGEDLKNIPKVDLNTNVETARRVFKQLRTKRDRIAGCLIFEESILGLAYGLEHIFDGKKEWFGTKVDLVGWPETIKSKLRSMRFDTSRFVSGVMSEYSISPIWRIALSIIPSMFFYSRERRLRSSSAAPVDDASYNTAMHTLA